VDDLVGKMIEFAERKNSCEIISIHGWQKAAKVSGRILTTATKPMRR
jgi:hypothetical protein